MENVSISRLNELSNSASRFYSDLSESQEWVLRNLKYEEQDYLNNKIKGAKVDVRKISKSVLNRPVFAMFGVSQVGKSYLVKNLLSVKGKSLMVGPNGEFDFLSEINPPGNGAESTGVVSRFTIESNYGDKEFPIQCKLLSVKDVLLILFDSYFNDLVKLEHYASKDTIQDFITKLQVKYNQSEVKQSYLSTDDLWEMKNYFSRRFLKFSFYVDIIESAGFWIALEKLIHKIPSEDLADVFGVIWNQSPVYNAVLNRLISELNSLEFESSVWVSTNAILRTGGHILDVSRLDGILDDDEIFAVKTKSGKELAARITLVSALCAELVLPLPENIQSEKDFLKNTDLLDFPGARGRLTLKEHDISELTIDKLYLRGKISFLFNSYSDNYEVNNLLFCMNDNQIEVNDLPDLVNSWIEDNIGRTSAERESNLKHNQLPPLFVVFTFFNRQLEFNPANDNKDLNYKWDNRFNKFFVEGAVSSKYDWHMHWTNSNPKFGNFYFLRDYRFSSGTFEGFEQFGVENQIVPAREAYMSKLKDSFLNFPFVQEHIENPTELWEKSAAPNQDGSDLIIQKLSPSANNFVKVQNYVSRLNGHRNSVVQELRNKLHVDDVSEQRKKAFVSARNIEFGFLRLFENPKIQFNAFLSQLLISETEVYNLIHSNLIESSVETSIDANSVFRQSYPMLSTEYSRAKNLELLKNELMFNSIQEVEDFLSMQGIDLDKVLENRTKTTSEKLVDLIIDHWKSKLSWENFQIFFQAGLTKSVFEVYTENLVKTFSLLHLEAQMVELFRKKIHVVKYSRESEEYLASVSTSLLNEFVTNFGYSFINVDKLNEIEELKQEFPIDFAILRNENVGVSEKELKDLFDGMGNKMSNSSSQLSDAFRLYIQKIKVVLLSNCGFVNFDIQSNNQLSDLVNRLEQLNFDFIEHE
jgi:hypothetical protein